MCRNGSIICQADFKKAGETVAHSGSESEIVAESRDPQKQQAFGEVISRRMEMRKDGIDVHATASRGNEDDNIEYRAKAAKISFSPSFFPDS